MDSPCPRRSHHRGGSVFFFGHLMAGDIDKVTSQPLRLYILYLLSCNPPGFLKFSRGKERNIKRLLDPFRSVYFCWYYTFSKIKMGATLDIIYTTNQRLFGGDSPDRIGWGGLEKSPKNGIRCCRFLFFRKSEFLFLFSFLSIFFFLLVSHVSTKFRLTTGVWMCV